MIKDILIFTLVSIAAISRAQPDTVHAISNDEFAQQETSVAISRQDKNLIVVGSNDDAMDIRSMPAYVTTDGGTSWDTYRLPKAPVPYGVIGDPVVIPDNDGGFYYAYLLFHDATFWHNILVSHSKDGKSWTYHSPVVSEPTGAYEDKEWVALDRSPQSSTYGRLYVTWTRLHPGIHSESGTFISWSDDTGKTWQPAKRIGSFVGTYTLVQVGLNGTVYVSYSQYSEYADSIGHYLSVSSDFGETFSERLVAKFINYPFSLGIGKPALKGGRVVSFPYMSYALDTNKNVLHAVYGSYDTAMRAATQLYTFSTDEGLSWSKPKLIGNPATLNKDRFQPWVVFDGVKGNLHAIYYSSERDEKNLLTSIYHARIEAENIIINSLSDTIFDPLKALDFLGNPFIGDYTGADLFGRTFAASWTQNRTGYEDGEIFVYVNHNIDSLQQGFVSRIKPARFYIETIERRENDYKIRLTSHIETAGRIELVDLQGKLVFNKPVHIAQGQSELSIASSTLSKGFYLIRIISNAESASMKLIVN